MKDNSMEIFGLGDEPRHWSAETYACGVTIDSGVEYLTIEVSEDADIGDCVYVGYCGVVRTLGHGGKLKIGTDGVSEVLIMCEGSEWGMSEVWYKCYRPQLGQGRWLPLREVELNNLANPALRWARRR